MLLYIYNNKETHRARRGLTLLVLACLMSAVFCGDTLAAGAKQKSFQKTFASPEEAVAALVAAVKANDLEALSGIFGPEGKQLISSGDDVADKNSRERFVQTYEEKNQLTKEGDNKTVLEVGKDGWPLPIPIVKVASGWLFDTKEGKEEILNRRIGKNELSTIQACLAYVDAQWEYGSKDRNGDGLFEYAQKFGSEPGKQDGLYWETKEGEEQSPLGPLVASAKKEGYTKRRSPDQPTPYHGYYYKILKAQGKNAPGGAFDYVVRGKMIGGFALVAYPAEYGASGIMTFIVSHSGDVYEKDLGKMTPSVVQAMKVFDPDKTWQKVKPKFLEPSGKGGGA